MESLAFSSRVGAGAGQGEVAEVVRPGVDGLGVEVLVGIAVHAVALLGIARQRIFIPKGVQQA
jgi:hypothetical protein